METAKMRLIRSKSMRIAALLALAALAAASPGRAEGLLDFLFGPSDPAPVPAAPQRAPRDSAAGRRAKSFQKAPVGEIRFAKPRESDSSSGFSEPSTGGFCVRTCDGYFFPLIKSTKATRQQSCEFACPSAPMEIYDGATIETARNAKGQRYSSLPVAFAFRDRTANNCSCNDPRSSQAYFEKMARSDPTLRSGDVVVEDEGAFVYSGTTLVPLRSASFMSSQLRDRLRLMLRRTAAAKPALNEAAGGVSTKPEVEVSKADRTGSTTP